MMRTVRRSRGSVGKATHRNLFRAWLQSCTLLLPAPN